MPLEALIFDVDGTLAETEETHRQSFNEAFAAVGLNWTWDRDVYRDLLQVTGGKERLQHYIDLWKPQDSGTAQARFTDIYAEKSARYAALVGAGNVIPRPGIRRLIREARARGVRLAIATTSLPGSVDALLRDMFGDDGPSWFSVIGAGDVVAGKKPAPDVYSFVLDALGCEPENCVAIEDSENGVRAAREADLPVVAVPSHYLKGDDFSLATSLLSDLGEPDRPCHQIAGLRFEKDYVDIDGLESWLMKQRPAAGAAKSGGD